MKLDTQKGVYKEGEGSSEPEDIVLARRHLAGDPSAFPVLVARYTPPIFNLVFRYTHDRAEAENLTQETLLRMYAALPRLKLDRPLRPYVFQIALNLCRDRAERERGVAQVDLDSSEDAGLVQAGLEQSGDGVLARMEAADLHERLKAAVEGLPPLYRAVIALRYTEGLSYEEIALALDRPLNTVRTHLRRAKEKLRESLEA